MALGIVGDTGPEDEIGEASVAMSRILNGLPEGAVPTNRADAERRFQGPRTILLVLPGEKNRAATARRRLGQSVRRGETERLARARTPGALPLGNIGSEVMGAAALLELRLAALLDELTGAPIT
jgi:hypothetical protein